MHSRYRRVSKCDLHIVLMTLDSLWSIAHLWLKVTKDHGNSSINSCVFRKKAPHHVSLNNLDFLSLFWPSFIFYGNDPPFDIQPWIVGMSLSSAWDDVPSYAMAFSFSIEQVLNVSIALHHSFTVMTKNVLDGCWMPVIKIFQEFWLSVPSVCWLTHEKSKR